VSLSSVLAARRSKHIPRAEGAGRLEVVPCSRVALYDEVMRYCIK
jgi:hypothetical protein